LKESDHGDTEAADGAAATAAAAGATAASTAADTASTASSTVAIATTGDVKKISTFGALKEELCRRTLAAEDSAPLSSFNFHENDKLMVLGRPPSTQTDAGWKQLLEFERKHIDKIQQTYNLNNVDLTELEKNFTNGR
uniref:Ubiquitin-like domain-containing protein n=1 Tax=Gongylonema pulchrum TaxID=637853 RepID=A0A183EWY5_9BILA